MSRLIATAVLLFASGCAIVAPTKTLVSEETVECEVLSVNPPKHVSVSLREVATGTIYENVRVSKHYLGWKRIIVGETVTLTKQTWKNDTGELSVLFPHIHEELHLRFDQ